MTGTLVKELMTSPVVTVSAALTAADALDLASERGVHHLPVYDAKSLVGFVCTCDLFQARQDALVSQVMREPITLPSESNAEQAARVLEHHGVGSALVTDGPDVCGIVTRRDLERAGEAGVERVLERVRCVCCGSLEHLATDRSGTQLCVECFERAHGDSSYDTGGG